MLLNNEQHALTRFNQRTFRKTTWIFSTCQFMCSAFICDRFYASDPRSKTARFLIGVVCCESCFMIFNKRLIKIGKIIVSDFFFPSLIWHWDNVVL